MTDNYNTEQSECLHINLAKEAYYAMNCKDEYLQMTAWLERRERIEWHAIFINMKQDIQQCAQPQRIIGPPYAHVQSVKMTDHPSAKAIIYDNLKLRYSAPRFQDALANFIAQVNYPSTRGNMLHKHAEDTLIPFCHILVFHVIKFTEARIAKECGVIDSVHARPEKMNTDGQITPSHFNTVLVQNPSQDTDQGHVKGN
jgi:hypothetical protein